MAYIKVYIRVRPLNAIECATGVMNIIEIPSATEICLNSSTENYCNTFLFDGIFPSTVNQHDIFRSVFMEVNEEVLKGFNYTIFAFGQAISGKTYTIFGNEYNLGQLERITSQIPDNSLVGAIPRTIHNLFIQLHRLKVEFSIRISYMTIFNEELSDLLSSTPGAPLKIYENSSGQLRINGLTEIVVPNPKAAYVELLKGQERLRTHNMMTGASKSHTIFTIMVYIKERPAFGDDEELLKFSKLSLVDLAANESASSSSLSSKTTPSARRINHSLLSFNRVIQALIDKSIHIPYRDSKLTRILQDSLGGNSKTAIIATIAPGNNNLEETVSTLEYVQRAKGVCNKPRVNEKLNKTIMLNDISVQINRLRRDIEANKTKTGRFLTDELYSDYQSQLNTSRHNLKIKRTEADALHEEYSHVEGLFSGVHSSLLTHNEKIQALQRDISITEVQNKRITQRSAEHECLIQKHSVTEEELGKQATELTEVVEKACDDIDLVHDSIERRGLFDREIKDACDRFSSEMKGHFVDIINFTEDNARNLRKMITKYAASCETRHKTTWAVLESLKQKAEILTQITTSIGEMDKIVKKTVSLATLNSAFKTESENRISNAIETKTRVHASQLTSDVFLKILETEEETSAQALNNIRSMISLQTDIVAAFSKKLTETGIKFKENLLKSIRKSRLTVDETNESTAKITAQAQTTFNEMSNVLNQINANNTVLFNEVEPTLISMETKVKQMGERQISYTNSQFNRLYDLEKYDNTFGASELNECQANVKKINSALEVDRNTQIEMASDNSNAIGAKADIVKTYEDIIEGFTKFTKKINVIPSNVKGNPLNEKITSDLEQKSQCATSDSVDKITKTTALQTSTNDFVTHMHESVDYCKQRLRQLHQNDFKVYEPNGDTPNKREYKINRVLAATSPHDRIKQRFYENYQNNFDSDLELSTQQE